VSTVIFEEGDLELRRPDRAAPKRGRDGGPHVTLAKAGDAKRHMSLNDHPGAAHHERRIADESERR
jgi:hypothetical protein